MFGTENSAKLGREELRSPSSSRRRKPLSRRHSPARSRKGAVQALAVQRRPPPVIVSAASVPVATKLAAVVAVVKFSVSHVVNGVCYRSQWPSLGPP